MSSARRYLGILLFVIVPASTQAAILTVYPDGSGSWPTIQSAIEASIDGDTILLADGTFTGEGNRTIPYTVTLHKELIIRSESGDPGSCIVDCEGTPGGQPRWFLQFHTSPSALLEGIGVVNAVEGGGAVASLYSNTIIRNCRFIGFTGNATALWSEGLEPVRVEDCLFEDNFCTGDYAGALMDLRGSMEVTGCLFVDNHASKGGAFRNGEGVSTLTGCTFYGNDSTEGSAVYCHSAGTVILVNCLLSFGAGGGAVACESGGSVDLSCCDVYGNLGGDYTGCIAGQLGVNDNISLDPLFCDGAAGDLTLDHDSPCLPANSPCGMQIGAFGQGCGNTGILESDVGLPDVVFLGQNVPNPFNPVTEIQFGLPVGATVHLRIHDAAGGLVRHLVTGRFYRAGQHRITWNGRDDQGRELAAGVYLCRLETPGFGESLKMLMLK